MKIQTVAVQRSAFVAIRCSAELRRALQPEALQDVRNLRVAALVLLLLRFRLMPVLLDVIDDAEAGAPGDARQLLELFVGEQGKGVIIDAFLCQYF